MPLLSRFSNHRQMKRIYNDRNHNQIEEEKVQKLCEMGISIFIRDKLIPPELLEKYNFGKKF